MWPAFCQYLNDLKEKCDSKTATFEDLKVIIFDLYFNFNKRNIATGYD
jgi:hypothetical protein